MDYISIVILCVICSIAIFVLVFAIMLLISDCYQKDETEVQDSNSRQLSSHEKPIDEENPVKDILQKTEMDFSIPVDRSLKNVEMDVASESKNIMTGQAEEFTNYSTNVSSHSNDIETAIDFQMLPFDTSISTVSLKDDDLVNDEVSLLNSQDLGQQNEKTVAPKIPFNLEAFESLTFDSQIAAMRDILSIKSLKSGTGIDSINKLDANMTAALETLRAQTELNTDELGFPEDLEALLKDENFVNVCAAVQLDMQLSENSEEMEEEEEDLRSSIDNSNLNSLDQFIMKEFQDECNYII